MTEHEHALEPRGDTTLAQPNFDIAALRSLVAGVDLGSFAKAADRVARSTSAVSAQIRKLEEQAGTPLFVKAGRGLALTDAGEAMLRYARRIVELNDEAAAALRGVNLDGRVRVGLQEDFGEAILPDVLGRFAGAARHSDGADFARPGRRRRLRRPGRATERRTRPVGRAASRMADPRNLSGRAR